MGIANAKLQLKEAKKRLFTPKSLKQKSQAVGFPPVHHLLLHIISQQQLVTHRPRAFRKALLPLPPVQSTYFGNKTLLYWSAYNVLSTM